MMNANKMKNIDKGMDFGRKAEEELTRTGSDKGWQILAEGYRKTAEELLSELKRHQKNPDLTRYWELIRAEEKREKTIKERWT